jgi:hypothetical protein
MKKIIEKLISFIFGVTIFQIVLLWEYLEEKKTNMNETYNTELNKNEKLSTENETPPIANVLLGDVLFVPQICMSWSSLIIDNFGVKVPINTGAGMGKYWMPVFETEDECKKEYPECEVVQLKRGRW